MKKFLLLPCLVSIVLFANSSPFTTENPYENISTIDDKQIVGEDFVEVYESQNNIEEPDFDFFGLLNVDDDQQDSVGDPTNPPLPSPINQYEIGLILIGMAIISKRKFY